MTTIAEALAHFAVSMRTRAAPPAVRERARHLILDAVGIAYASARHDFARDAVEGVRSIAGTGDIPVIGLKVRLPPRDAALANGILVHALDFDDTHLAGVVHATASVWPATLATAWFCDASPTALLGGYLVGMEATARLGMVAGAKFPPLGLHPTCLFGAFGCALAAGYVAGLDHDALVMAQGIALSMASGVLECHEEGAASKRLHPGWAAQAGVAAAFLARHGVSGPRRPYEGRFGVYRTFLQGESLSDEQLAVATHGLGEAWETANVAIKPFPAVHFAHACADAAIALKSRHALRPSDIAGIRALVPEAVIRTICEPRDAKRRPANAYAAQFSLPYIVSASLVRGRFTLDELNAGTLADEQVLSLAALVEHEIDPLSDYPNHFSGELRIRLKDGSEVVHREAQNRGCPERPITNDEIVAKFTANAAPSLGHVEAAAVRNAVLGMEQAHSAREAIRAIVREEQ
jgi:2-methylcitrate dehydratase PrpD